MKKSRSLYWVVILPCLLIAACECDDSIPPDDGELPEVALNVVYQDAEGVSQRAFVDTDERALPITVNIPRENGFQITLAASDGGGVKETVLHSSYTEDVGDGQGASSGPLTTPTVYNSCPGRTRIQDYDYQASSNPRVYRFYAVARDYRGNQNQTPDLIVRQN